MERDIRGEILGASFYENWNYARELYKGKSPKARVQFIQAMRIQREWLAHRDKVMLNVIKEEVEDK